MQTLADKCQTIAELWYQRQMLVREDGNHVRQLKAYCRRHVGGKDSKAEGTKLFNRLVKGKVDPAFLGGCVSMLERFHSAEKARKAIEKVLYAAVRELPVWPWIENIRGVSENALASIVGEAGDLNRFRDPSCLWARFGVGLRLHKGEQIRQRKAKDKKLAELMAYSPKRRAALYVIGGNIIKARKGATGIAADLLAHYEQEKAKAKAKTYEGGKPFTKSHAHKRAQRHMEKLLLKLLWREWTGRGQDWVEPMKLAA